MRTLFFISVLTLIFIKAYSQSYEMILEKPNLKYTTYSKFYKGTIIIVMGENCPDYKLYQGQIDRYRNRTKSLEVKKESELVDSDYKKHLYFYGQINWYKNWNKLNLPIKVTKNGFLFGNIEFINEKNAIMLMNSLKDRYAFVGNSLSAFDDRGSWGAYDYFVLDNSKRIQWGNLSDNRFDSLRRIDGIKDRSNTLKNSIKQDYLNIFYPYKLTDNEKYFTNLDNIKIDLDKIIGFLELKSPKYVIDGYIYKDKEQKIQLCYHEGYGVAYPEWNEINVIFDDRGNNGLLIHESIHILFNNEMGNANNSCLLGEGIVGYAMYILDSIQIKKDQEKALLCFEDPIEKWFDERINTGGGDIPSSKLYPISAAWVRYLINEFGLDKFKKLYAIPRSELRFGYDQIYKKSITELTANFKEYIKKSE